MATDVHQVITDKIVAALEGNGAVNGAAPGTAPAVGALTNFVTGKPNHRINTLSLWLRLLRTATQSSGGPPIASGPR